MLSGPESSVVVLRLLHQSLLLSRIKSVAFLVLFLFLGQGEILHLC